MEGTPEVPPPTPLEPGTSQSWSGELELLDNGDYEYLISLDGTDLGSSLQNWLYTPPGYVHDRVKVTLTVTITDIIPPPPKRTHTPIPKAPALFGCTYEVGLFTVPTRRSSSSPATHYLLWQEGSRKAILRNTKGDRFVSINAALIYMEHNNSMWIDNWTPHNLAMAAAFPNEIARYVID